jgi:DNA-3-methyladenine glycosylase II
MEPLTNTSMANAVNQLCRRHSELDRIFSTYGLPPLWDREPGFATLLQIILEQQVSLASAKACFDKLVRHLGSVTPENLLVLNDTELKTIGFSRQKTAYARHLSEAILEDRLDLASLHDMPDAEVKAELLKLKGIGEWTSDIYLLMALLRPDVMPRGDIALHAAYQKLSGAEKRPSSDEFIVVAEKWRPYRSIAARLLWHFYLSEKRNDRRPTQRTEI